MSLLPTCLFQSQRFRNDSWKRIDFPWQSTRNHAFPLSLPSEEYLASTIKANSCRGEDTGLKKITFIGTFVIFLQYDHLMQTAQMMLHQFFSKHYRTVLAICLNTRQRQSWRNLQSYRRYFFGGGHFPFDILIGNNAIYTSKYHESLKIRKLLE